MGYNKYGSAEGYCSGGGIKNLTIDMLKIAEKKGVETLLTAKISSYDDITAKLVSDLAKEGDKFCLSVFKKSGKYLGRALSIIIDLLNPEIIVIGGIFMRSSDLLLPTAKKVIDKECLSHTRKVCKIAPAGLGEKVGDYSALAVAYGRF